MKTLKLFNVTVALASILFASTAFSQDAKTLNELLDMIESSAISETAEARKREADFVRDQRRQSQLLKQARDTEAAEERRSDRLEKTIRDNDIQIAKLREQKDKRLGSLKELFGHLTGAAGDIRAKLEQSIVSAQYTGRTEFLSELIDKMSSDTRLPSIEEIEQLWFEHKREMIESSKIVKFNRNVLMADGQQAEMEVVRIGTYNLLSDGKYLEYSPETGLVSELARQPSG